MQARPSASVHVCALRHIPEVLNNSGARHLISAINADLAPATPTGLMPERHLRLDMHDIQDVRDGATAPAEEHVGHLIDFVQSWDREAPLLIHCYAGLSRSTAAAFITLCALNPPSPCGVPPIRRCRTGASCRWPMLSSSARGGCWRHSMAWAPIASLPNACPSSSTGTTRRSARTAPPSRLPRDPSRSILGGVPGTRPIFMCLFRRTNGRGRWTGMSRMHVDRDGKPMPIKGIRAAAPSASRHEVGLGGRETYQ
jgi:hypothetical protein